MVDRNGRDASAELLHHFAARVIANDEYEARADRIIQDGDDDPALWNVWLGSWPLYDDVRTHRLRGRWALPRSGRRQIARWILFLYSDREYEWPNPPIRDLGAWLLSIATLGRCGKPRARKRKEMGSAKDWPSFRSGDLAAEMGRPGLFTGGRRFQGALLLRASACPAEGGETLLRAVPLSSEAGPSDRTHTPIVRKKRR